MNKFSLILASAVMTFAAGAYAQNKAQKQAAVSITETAPLAETGLKKHSLGLGLGQTILFGDFDKNGDNGIRVDAFYGYSASYSFDLLANLHYSEHSFQGREVSVGGVAASIKGKAFQFDNFSPFALAGLGFYLPQINDSDTKWTFGTNFGAGVDLLLNNHFTFGFLVQFHNPFDVKQENAPKVEGSYSKVLLTTMYTF